MAQSKSFFGLRRGSTKSLTFQVFNGKQVTKDRVESVKNPRTPAQMDQRMIMKTVGGVYSAMREIVDHSFQGYTYGMQNMSHFLSINADRLRGWLTNPAKDPRFLDYGQSGLVASPWKVSEGTASHILGETSCSQTSEMLVVNLKAEINGDLTADALMSALGVSVGHMATVVVLFADFNGEANFGFIRFTFLKGGTTVLTTANLAEYVKVESNLPDIQTSVGTFDDAKGIHVQYVYEGAQDEGDCTWATIHSAKVDGVWTRSNEILSPEAFFGGDLYDDAIATYPVGEAKILNGGNF